MSHKLHTELLWSHAQVWVCASCNGHSRERTVSMMAASMSIMIYHFFCPLIGSSGSTWPCTTELNCSTQTPSPGSPQFCFSCSFFFIFVRLCSSVPKMFIAETETYGKQKSEYFWSCFSFLTHSNNSNGNDLKNSPESCKQPKSKVKAGCAAVRKFMMKLQWPHLHCPLSLTSFLNMPLNERQ